MTIEEVVQVVSGYIEKPVTPETELKKIVDDSLDFVDLILYVSSKCGDIPDALVPKVNTVNDLYLAATGQL